MKDTFDRLPAEKQDRIMEASIAEFGEQGFSGGSTDRICRKAGISKGGLYEYIDGKEELFAASVSRVYAGLYDWIRGRLADPPADILDRFMRVSEIAIDFYLAHPAYIGLIQQSNALPDGQLRRELSRIFRDHFQSVFGDLDGSALRFPVAEVVDFLGWFLLKTRNDFLSGWGRGEDGPFLREAYLKEWRFCLDALKGGIYQ